MSASKIFSFFFASSLLALTACGSTTLGGTGGGGSTGTGTDTGGGGGVTGSCDFTYPKACTADTDCVVKIHQLNCCGTSMAVGVASSGAADFDAEEAACDATYPKCGCATMGTKAEDGTTNGDFSGASIPVKCDAGKCTTYNPPGLGLCNGVPSLVNCESTGCPSGWACTKDPDPNTCHSSQCYCDTDGWKCTSDCGQNGSSCMQGL
jgi:hypothetical protein